jgi:hypothetical protein
MTSPSEKRPFIERAIEKFDEIGFGDQARIVGTKRVELKVFLRQTIEDFAKEVETQVIEYSEPTIGGGRTPVNEGVIRNQLRVEQRQKLYQLIGGKGFLEESMELSDEQMKYLKNIKVRNP